MCIFGFLHIGEVVVPSDHEYDESMHLGTVDNMESPQCLEIRIKASKIQIRAETTAAMCAWHTRLVNKDAQLLGE